MKRALWGFLAVVWLPQQARAQQAEVQQPPKDAVPTIPNHRKPGWRLGGRGSVGWTRERLLERTLDGVTFDLRLGPTRKGSRPLDIFTGITYTYAPLPKLRVDELRVASALWYRPGWWAVGLGVRVGIDRFGGRAAYLWTPVFGFEASLSIEPVPGQQAWFLESKAFIDVPFVLFAASDMAYGVGLATGVRL